MSPWDVLVPPRGVDTLLRRRVEEAGTPRLRRLRRKLPLARSAPAFQGGRLRGWIQATEDALSLREARGSDLVARVAGLGLLAELAPGGKIPRDFVSRAAGVARAQLRRQLEAWNAPDQVREDDPDLGLRAGDASLPLGLSVGRVVTTRGTTVRIGNPDPRFERNVVRALDFLGAVWPDAAQMVGGRTWRVVPVVERGMVSYSSAARPGITWIQRSLGRGTGVAGAMHLAEHLLHEGTHQRVHDLEVLAPIAPSDDEGPRFYSPWRKEWRPLRGLLHGACTFTVGAGYFARALQAGEAGAVKLPPAERRWLARRFLEEMENVRVAVRYLERAALPRAGKRLLATVKHEHAALRPEARRRRAALSGGERSKVDAHARELETRPLRWGT
ncbi:MAG TPA: HEXXH motif-containing putative peptide modification protein [Candidatus Polarisedimenticolaceae bacterium]|nr:HEXXH motif-containing putative peptide modification protein [Candidatus Polarisedimenticolaceae bacterium]